MRTSSSCLTATVDSCMCVLLLNCSALLSRDESVVLWKSFSISFHTRTDLQAFRCTSESLWSQCQIAACLTNTDRTRQQKLTGAFANSSVAAPHVPKDTREEGAHRVSPGALQEAGK